MTAGRAPARPATVATTRGPATWPGWLLALGVWLVARAATWLVTTVVARGQVENLWTAASPGYLDFVTIWDGRWYEEIAEQGYPQPLPTGPDGRPAQSAWAFFPAYPALVRLLMTVSGQDYRPVAAVTSLALGCGVGVVAYRLFRTRASRGPALAGVAVLAVFPSSAVLQYGYGDVLSLLALLTALLLVVRRRYLWCLPAVAALGLSRPVGLPFALVVAVHLVVRWRARRTDPFATRERVAVLALGVATVVSSLAFPAAVGLAVGDVDGYTQVQDAWRSGDDVRYFTPWWGIARLLLGDLRGAVLLGLLVVVVLAVLASRPARRLGPELWAWCAAYALYLAAVVEPWSSLVRQLLLFAPLALAASVALLGDRRRRRWVAVAALLVALFALQVLWVDVLWRFEPPTDPPP